MYALHAVENIFYAIWFTCQIKRPLIIIKVYNNMVVDYHWISFKYFVQIRTIIYEIFLLFLDLDSEQRGVMRPMLFRLGFMLVLTLFRFLCLFFLFIIKIKKPLILFCASVILLSFLYNQIEKRNKWSKKNKCSFFVYLWKYNQWMPTLIFFSRCIYFVSCTFVFTTIETLKWNDAFVPQTD